MPLQPTVARNKKAKISEAHTLLIDRRYKRDAKASLSVRSIFSKVSMASAGIAFMPSGVENYYKKIAPTISKTQISKTPNIIKIQLLHNFKLNQPIDAVIEPDDDGFIARTIDIPLFGYGDDSVEAITALKNELESLYKDLMEDDQFSSEWLKLKKFLKERISPIK